MPIVADLHIHSPLSRATSREITPETLHLWAQKKGISILGTGDCTHPSWFGQLAEKLEPAEEGLWKLRDELTRRIDPLVPESCRRPVRFVFQTEISTIYKKQGKTRKVHHLILLPDKASVKKLSERLDRVGNLTSDGRPILGLDSRDLLETVLESCEEAIFIPAHIWTPWFSVFGSKSGFDDLEACYGELTGHITALETGLSSDPMMNWRCSRLDPYHLVSNSDAHSPSKLGREANLFEIPLAYPALAKALRTGSGLGGTIEFFPEEGKYHLDGHRKCDVQLHPAETRMRSGACPKCGKPVTVGVMHRVEELGDRESGSTSPNAKPFLRLLPLDEVLAEILGCGAGTKRVQRLHQRLLERFGPELTILREVPPQTIEESRLVPSLAEAIRRMREGRVLAYPGFDGQYGRIRLFRDEERGSLDGQRGFLMFMNGSGTATGPEADGVEAVHPDPPVRPAPQSADGPRPAPEAAPSAELSPRQLEAVLHGDDPLMIVAGPGSGKTLTLTCRIAHVLNSGRCRPGELLAATFTHRAAQEMRDRLGAMLQDVPWRSDLRIMTLHAFGHELLRAHAAAPGSSGTPFLLDEDARAELLKEVLEEAFAGVRFRSLSSLMEKISRWKQMSPAVPPPESLVVQIGQIYDERLRRRGAMDFDDLIRLPLLMLEQSEALRREIQQKTRFIFVDEYQDLNPIQVALIKQLVPPDGHITVIGDPDQSIYGFRGASATQFQRFMEDFPRAVVIRLEENHRCSKHIAEAARCVIQNNPLPLPRASVSRREKGALLRLCAFDTERSEAIFIAHQIDRLLGGTSHWSMHRAGEAGLGIPQGLSFGDVAVLYRLHTVGGALEGALFREGIPFHRYGTRPLRGHRVLGGILAALRWIVDPGRGADLLGCLSLPSVGLSEKTIDFLRDLSGGDGVRMTEKLESPGNLDLPEPQDAVRIQRQMRLLDGLLKASRSASVGQLVERLIAALRIHVPEPASVWRPEAEALGNLIRSARSWREDLVSFLDLWTTREEIDLYDPRADRVSLLSIHAAKGLEFPVVFLAGCEEGLMPHGMEGPDGDLEEERRLFYVALTRARDLVTLTWARTRHIRGQRRPRKPSRFLAEIPPHLLSRDEHPADARQKGPRQLKLF